LLPCDRQEQRRSVSNDGLVSGSSQNLLARSERLTFEMPGNGNAPSFGNGRHEHCSGFVLNFASPSNTSEPAKQLLRNLARDGRRDA
jgi:hypothetical protein